LAWGRRDFLLPLSVDGREAQRCISGAVLREFDTGHAPFAEAAEVASEPRSCVAPSLARRNSLMRCSRFYSLLLLAAGMGQCRRLIGVAATAPLQLASNTRARLKKRRAGCNDFASIQLEKGPEKD
jgi:hypothetical protein